MIKPVVPLGKCGVQVTPPSIAEDTISKGRRATIWLQVLIAIK